MFCSKCGAESPGDSAFCSNCGQKLVVDTCNSVCPQCGNQIQNEDLFCKNCGTKIYTPMIIQSNPTSENSVAPQIHSNIDPIPKKVFAIPRVVKYLGKVIIIIVVLYLARDILSMPISYRAVPHKTDLTISNVRDGYIADQTDVTLGTVLESERPEGTWSTFEQNGIQGVIFDYKVEAEEMGFSSQETIRFVLLDKERFQVESIRIQLFDDDGGENITLTSAQELSHRMIGYYIDYYSSKYPQDAALNYLSDTDFVNFTYGASSSYTGSRNFVETLSMGAQSVESASSSDMLEEQFLSSNAQSTDEETFKLDTMVPHFYIQDSDSGYAYNPGLETSMVLYPDGTFQYNHTFPEDNYNISGCYKRQGDILLLVLDGSTEVDFAKKGAILLQMQGNLDCPSLEFVGFDPPLDYDPIEKGTIFNEVAELFYQKHETNKGYISRWIDESDFKVLNQEQAKEIMNVFLKQKFGGHNVSFMISEDNVGYSFEVRYIDSNGAMSSLLGNFYVDKLTGLIFDAVLGDRVYDDN